jgi:hypothetical protein
MVEYHRTLASDSEGLKLSVMVLRQGVWPYSVQNDLDLLVLPQNMQDELRAFEAFYALKRMPAFQALTFF